MSNEDAIEVKQTIIRMVNGIDRKEWSKSREAFADKVFVDYSSLNKQKGSEILSDALIEGWKNLLSVASTHHMVSNFEITVGDSRSESECHVYAVHQAQGIESWDCFGRYLHTLENINGQWEITRMTLIIHGQKGNLSFLQDISR